MAVSTREDGQQLIIGALGQLRVGMTLRQDVFTDEQVMLASDGTVPTDSLLERLRNFAHSVGVGEPITAAIPAGQPA